MIPASRVLLRRYLCYGKNILWRRSISTAHFDPILHNFTSKMAAKQPTFALSPDHIRILSQPSEFYSLLLDMIKRAEHRIFISSLYIGSEETEILDMLAEALKNKPTLQIHLQLDFNRSTRPGPSSTAKLLLPLLEQYSDRVHVSMFRSPSLRGIMAKIVPPRFNEGWGTWHAKVYGVDDEVIISGANLNKSYFTDRQDRYLHFTAQPLLSQYCFDFLQMVSKFSFRLLPLTAPNAVTPYSDKRDGYVLQWPDASTHPHTINEKARDILTSFQKSRQVASNIQLETNMESTTNSSQQVLIFPVIQAGQFGVREEESSLQLLFKHINAAVKVAQRKRPLFDLTSGYFSLYKPYQKLVLGSRNIDCKILAASPKANGFFGSKGISGRIPEGYTYYEKRFMRAVRKAGRLWREAASGGYKGVQLSEWDKQGWTYHAKGIWLSPSPKSLPILTLFGSTNLNARSAHLDTELSFVMVLPSRNLEQSPSQKEDSSTNDTNISKMTTTTTTTTDRVIEVTTTTDTHAITGLRERLQQEIDNIRANATPWKGNRRKVRFSTMFIVWLVKGML